MHYRSTNLRVLVFLLPAADGDDGPDQQDARHADQEGEDGREEEAPPFAVLRKRSQEWSTVKRGSLWIKFPGTRTRSTYLVYYR